MSTSSTGNTILPGPLPTTPTGTAILSGEHYRSEAFFALEQHRIFGSGWIWAGYAHWVGEPGAVHPVEVGGKPLLLIRGEDGQLRAFHNACRHRGMAIVDEPVIVKKRLQCDYHCWSYDLTGSLATAPLYRRARHSRISDAERRQLGLIGVPVHCWAGMVFVNVGDSPSAFVDDFGPLLQRWDHVDLSRLQLAGERRYDIDANWKLVVENFLDFYHLPFIHPQVGPVAASLDVDDLVIAENIIGAEYPHGAVGKDKKTERPLPIFAGVPPGKTQGQDLFCAFPNTLLILEADWLQVIAFQPMSPTRTVEHMAVFVDRDAADASYDEARSQLCNTLFAINDQDLPILAKLQTGRRSPASDRASLVPHWDQVTALFQDLVARRTAERG